MLSKIFNKLKSILNKNSSAEINKAKKVVKSTKAKKSSKSTKTSKTKKQDKKGIIDSFTKLPGIGAKSAKAFYEAGFKSPQDILSAKDEQLLAIPGVGVNLIKKLRNLKT